MHRAAFVGIVKVFTVSGDAVDKRSAFYAALLLKTKHGAIAVLLERAERSLDIKLMARRNANARHIHDQSLPNMLAQCVPFRVRIDNAFGKLLRNGHRRSCIVCAAHLTDFLRSAISFHKV